MIRDSCKPWAVLFMVANKGGWRIWPEYTEFFWTRWGARRRVQGIGQGERWRAKVVSNR